MNESMNALAGSSKSSFNDDRINNEKENRIYLFECRGFSFISNFCNTQHFPLLSLFPSCSHDDCNSIYFRYLDGSFMLIQLHTQSHRMIPFFRSFVRLVVTIPRGLFGLFCQCESFEWRKAFAFPSFFPFCLIMLRCNDESMRLPFFLRY